MQVLGIRMEGRTTIENATNHAAEEIGSSGFGVGDFDGVDGLEAL
jgi:hypothetical protein